MTHPLDEAIGLTEVALVTLGKRRLLEACSLRPYKHLMERESNLRDAICILRAHRDRKVPGTMDELRDMVREVTGDVAADVSSASLPAKKQFISVVMKWRGGGCRVTFDSYTVPEAKAVAAAWAAVCAVVERKGG